MPDVYVSQIDFGDGILRSFKGEGGGGITDFVDVPTVEETEFKEDGTLKELVFENLDATKVTVSGTTSATQAGNYTCTLTLASEQYFWKDLTNEPKVIEWTVEASFIYGVEWDGTATTTWTRTDAAQDFTDPNPAINNGDGTSPFDNIMPWAGMEIVEDSEAGTLVKIPKFYYKWTQTGTAMKLQITDAPFEGFSVSPAHSDKGDGQGERDTVYVARYKCCTPSYRSQSGYKPIGNKTRGVFRSSIHNLGSTIWQWDYAMYWTIMMLYLVEYADWNAQTKIGYGGLSGTTPVTMGATDNMVYHTGTSATNRTTSGGHIQYRHIEDLWANTTDYVDGIRLTSYAVYIITNPSEFSGSTGGTSTSYGRTKKSGYIKSWVFPMSSEIKWALLPYSVGGSDSTYISDSYSSNDNNALSVGSYYNSGANGPFSMSEVSENNSEATQSSRLMKLPNNT